MTRASSVHKAAIATLALALLAALPVAFDTTGTADARSQKLPFSNNGQPTSSLPFNRSSDARPTGEQRPRTYAELLEVAKRSGSVAVIVTLKTSFKPEGKLGTNAAKKKQRSRIAGLQQTVLDKTAALKVTGVKRFRFIPSMTLVVNAAALKKLASLPEVEKITEDIVLHPALAESVPLIGAPNVWAAGSSGQGQTIAVLDSGIDGEHPFLADKVVSEACYSENLCPAGEGAYEGAGVNCPREDLDCFHGTFVAGVAAGNGADFSGVAKDANLISVQIFSVVGDPPDEGLGAHESDIISGLEQIYKLQKNFDIAAVNMSLGSPFLVFEEHCDQYFPDIYAAIANLRSAGIATVVAAGNGGWPDAISTPACLSNTFSVGSTTEQDTVSPFSNRADYMDLYAPGSEITSSVPGDGFETHEGTSAAAPHVAGAWAVMKSAEPSADTTDVLSAFTYTGAQIHDDQNPYSIKPRIQVDAALQRLTGFPQQHGGLDLLHEANVQVDGAAEFNFAGWSVAGAGDVNGDGVADTIVGAPDIDSYGGQGDGSAYVVFGGSSFDTPIDLDQLGDRGFRIEGAATRDGTGWSVAGAGDVNGDGLADVIVGSPDANNNGRQESGSASVIFGIADDPNTPDVREDASPVDLAELGDRGFRIDGADGGDRAGHSVEGAGDVNGDGFADVIVGAPDFDGFGGQGYGSAYVVFGGSPPDTPIDLDQLGDRGFRIEGAATRDGTGWSVAITRDINDDGLADVIVGSPYASNNGREGSGSASVIFGVADDPNTPDVREDASPVDLAGLGDRGFRIDGASGAGGNPDGDEASTSVASAGDVNGDGRMDVIVGAPNTKDENNNFVGSAYVVFGEASTSVVDLAQLGDRGFRIEGAVIREEAGSSVNGAGDMNGDRLSDVIVGSPYASNNGREEAGSASVIFGMADDPNTPDAREDASPVDLAGLGDRGFRIDGAAGQDANQITDLAGWSVAGAGDVNGDRRPDVIVGAPGARNNDRTMSGSAYIVYGFGKPRIKYRQRFVRLRQSVPMRPLVPKVRHTGVPNFTVNRKLPRGLRLNPFTGVISGRPRRPQFPRYYRETMTDLTGSASTALRIGVRR